MSVEGARARFRKAERRLMTSTITVKRDTGPPTFNSDTGQFTQPESTAYTGVALIRAYTQEGGDRQVADTEVRARWWRVKVPHGTKLQPSDRVTVNTSDNPSLVNKKLRISDFFGDDWSPSDPYLAEEVTG